MTGYDFLVAIAEQAFISIDQQLGTSFVVGDFYVISGPHFDTVDRYRMPLTKVG